MFSKYVQACRRNIIKKNPNKEQGKIGQTWTKYSEPPFDEKIVMDDKYFDEIFVFRKEN